MAKVDILSSELEMVTLPQSGVSRDFDQPGINWLYPV